MDHMRWIAVGRCTSVCTPLFVVQLVVFDAGLGFNLSGFWLVEETGFWWIVDWVKPDFFVNVPP